MDSAKVIEYLEGRIKTFTHNRALAKDKSIKDMYQSLEMEHMRVIQFIRTEESLKAIS